MKIERIFDLLENLKNKTDKPIFSSKKNGEWKGYTYREYINLCQKLSTGLLEKGVQKGDTIASIAHNCPEWNIIDMAIQQCGAIHVPLYTNINEDDYAYILQHSESSILFISGEDIYNKISHLIRNRTHIKQVYFLEESRNTLHWTSLLSDNEEYTKKLEEVKSSICSDDTATIIYTSGTTGTQKGAMLSHKNIISNFLSVYDLAPVDAESRVYSYLPLCHVYERMINYMYQYIGASVYYAENMASIMDNIREIQAHMFTSVPRLLEKAFDRIQLKGRNMKGIRKKIFFAALNHALKYDDEKNMHLKVKIKHIIFNKLIYKNIRKAFGDHLRVIVTGGAALQERLARFFWAIGIPVLEGYGLTETSPVIAVNTFQPGGKKFGTVGPLLEGVEVQIAEDGEILCRGQNIMKGYFKETDLNNSIINSEGWFHTGDLGSFVDGRFLKIEGRKRNVFKTSMGKFISPEHIESKFRESRFIEQCMVVGENQKFAAALIVPDFQYLQMWLAMKNLTFIDNTTAVQNPKVKARYKEETDWVNKHFSQHERIVRFILLDREWTIESGELTPTLKIRRKIISEKYATETASLFQ
jgi:long-chain acyl-CoA synthetase